MAFIQTAPGPRSPPLAFIGKDAAGGRLWGRDCPIYGRRGCCESANGCGVGSAERLGCIRGPEPFHIVAFGACGSLAVALTKARKLFLLHLEGNRYTRIYVEEILGATSRAEAGSLCFAPRNCEVLLGVSNRISVIDIHTHRVVAHLSGHKLRVMGLIPHSASGLVLSSSRDAALLWDSASNWRHPLRSFFAETTQFVGSELGCGGNHLVATLGCNGRLWLWGDSVTPNGQHELPTCKLDGNQCTIHQAALGQSFLVAIATASNGDAQVPVHSRLGVSGHLFVRWPVVSAIGRIEKPDLAEAVDQVKEFRIKELAGGSVSENRDVAFCMNARFIYAMIVSSWQVLFAVETGESYSSFLHDVVTVKLHRCALAAVSAANGDLQIQVFRPSAKPRSRSAPSCVRAVDSIRICSEFEPMTSTEKAEVDGIASQFLSDDTMMASVTGVPKSNDVIATPDHTQHRLAIELRKYLGRRGSFPEHMRPSAWRILLALPGNNDAYCSLCARGPHPDAVACVGRDPPPGLGSGSARARLVHVVSALMHWAPVLSKTDFLPALVFPFTRLFGADELTTFEFCMVFFLNWGLPWLTDLPMPPIDALAPAAELLRSTDHVLYLHLMDCTKADANGEQMASLCKVFWVLHKTLFFDALPYDTCLNLWDYLIARWQEPMLLNACLVAFLQRRRRSLLKLRGSRARNVAQRSSSKKDPKCSDGSKIGVLDVELTTRKPITGSVWQLVREADDILRADSIQRDAAANASRMKSLSPTVSLPLAAGLSYPSLPHNGTSPLDRITEVQRRMRSDYLSTTTPAEISSQVRTAAQRLEKVEKALREEAIAAELNRQVLYAQAEEEVARFATAQQVADDDALHVRQEQANKLNAGVRDTIQRQKAIMEADAQLIRRDIDLRRHCRAEDERTHKNVETSLEAMEKDLASLLGKLQEDRDQIAAQHIARIAELHRCRRSALTEFQRRQLQGTEKCSRIRLLHGVSRQDEGRRMEELAQLRRAAESDLCLDRLRQELGLSHDEHIAAIGRAELHGEVLFQDSSRLRDQRRKLAQEVEQRAREADEAREEVLDGLARMRWTAADCAANEDDLRLDRERRIADEEIVQFNAERRSRKRLKKKLLHDAAAAQRAEDNFRRAFLDLDEIRRAEDLEGFDTSSTSSESVAGSMQEEGSEDAEDGHGQQGVSIVQQSTPPTSTMHPE